MKVSVSIVTYNHERVIGECLESVVAQKTSFPFEVVVGEDASPDGTARVVREYAARHPGVVRPIFHSPNVGVRRNWEAVLRACAGDYVAHVDGDDRMLPGKLQKQAGFLDAHPEVSVVFHRVRLFDSDSGRTVGEMPRAGEPLQRTADDIVRHRNIFSSASPMFRRAALPESLDPGLHTILDWYAQITAATRGQVGFIDEVLGEYRQHAGGASRGSLAAWERLVQDQLHTLTLVRRMGVSASAADEAEARIRERFADRLLLAGRDQEFGEWIRASGRALVLSPAHAVRLRLAAWPRTARALVRLGFAWSAARDRLRRPA